MTDDQTPDRKTPQTAPRTDADRIAKVMARAGVASRREAERMIVEGRVSVNGKKIDSPALDVLPTDRITVDGTKLEDPQETRLWLYYKPLGLITSENDELGRQTVFDALPREMPRVMTIGRLDLNSEGLLLLTNDGELKRRLELPATGWLRRYRVRVNGTPSDMTFDPLRRGVTIEGEDFSPMEIKLDSQQGANAWISVGIREGKNREIRRAMAHVGLQVNRLIRIGYGPFKLTGIDKNQVIEVKRKVMRDQLGGLLTGDVDDKPREMRPRGAEGARGPRLEAGDAGPRRFAAKPGFAGKPAFAGNSGAGKPGARGPGDRRSDDDRAPRSWGAKAPSGDEARPRFQGKPAGPRGDFGDRPRPAGDKPRWKSGAAPEARGGPSDKPRPARFPAKPGDARKPFGAPRDGAPEGGRKPYGKPRGDVPDGARKPYGGPRGDAGDGARKPYGAPRDAGAEGGRKPYGKPRDAGAGDAGASFGKPRFEGGKPYAAPRGDGPKGPRKPFGAPRDGAGEGPRKPYAGSRPGEGGKPRAGGGGKPFGAPRPERGGDRPAGPGGAGKPFGAGRPPGGGKPGGGKPGGGARPGGAGKPGGKPRAPRG